MAVAGTRVKVNKLLVTLNKDVETNDPGELSFFTGCTITQDTEKGLNSISQKAFIETLARRFDVATISPYLASPCANLGAREEGESGGTWPYKEAVGGLMWLVIMSRSDIINAVRAVSHHSNSPAEMHLKAVLQIIRYLLGTKDLCLTFEWGSGLQIPMFAGANYAEKADDRRSVSGVAVTVGKSSVSLLSSTQKIVNLATTEYVALGDGVNEALFGKGVVSFIIPSISENCVKVFVDNDGEISLAINLLSSVRTKHINVRFHFIRESTRSKTISVEYVPTKEQRADILTKALTGAIFKEHRDFLTNLHG